MNITEKKRSLRKEAISRRKKYSEEERVLMSGRIMERILELDEFRTAQTVFLYMDISQEVKTGALIDCCLKMGKRVAVPRVEGNVMHFYEIDSPDHLMKGTMGIPEPDPAVCPCADTEEQALMIMPGVAFDRKLGRIGYGGGFYDRYLAEHPHHPTVAVAYECQIFDEIPCEDTDLRPQMLVTEQGCYLK